MKEKFAELETILEGLVERDGPGVLVVACSDIEVLYLAKMLRGLDERSESDLYLSFVAQAPTLRQFIDAVVSSFVAQDQEVAQAMHADGRAYPSIPAIVHDAEVDPVSRIQALVEHARSLLPEGDHRLVISLLPVEVGDREGLDRLTEALVRGSRADNLRLILRGDTTKTTTYALAEAWPDETVLAYHLELTTDDLVDATAAAAQDPSRPAAERMQALLQLAYLDFGYKRLDEAEAKFSGLARYYEATGEAHLQALSLSGVADVHRARGDLVSARASYERALVAVAGTQAVPVTLQVCISTADACFALGAYEDAEGYYTLADQIATKIVNAYAKADVRESLGLCRLRRGAPTEAEQIWRETTMLCRDVDYPKRLASVLGRLAELHGDILPDRHARKEYLRQKKDIDARLKAEGLA